ncbi:MAG TPA: hypothetical protein VE197_09205 [Mycobacterium sp.]|nr:hypothetical protein [Mycobacterium sp.]
MRLRKIAAAVAAGAAVAVAVASSASAVDCRNLSRHVSAADDAVATTATPLMDFPIGVDPNNGQTVYWNIMPDFHGNWYLLALSEGGPEPTGSTVDVLWGFIPPGTVTDAPGIPGVNGQYTNGQVDDLLGLSACPVARQDIHGIVSEACGTSS